MVVGKIQDSTLDTVSIVKVLIMQSGGKSISQAKKFMKLAK